MVRVYTLTFSGKFRGTKEQEDHLHESPSSMTLPLIILAILSIFGGVLNLPHLIGGGSSQKMALWLSKINSLKAIPPHVSHLSHSMEIMLMLIATVLVVVLGSLSYFKYKKQTDAELNQPRQGFSLWGEHKFYVDELYHNLFVKPLEALADFFFYYIEHYFIQPITFGSSRIVYSAGQLLRIVQNGNIEYYLVYIAIGAVLVLSLSMFVF